MEFVYDRSLARADALEEFARRWRPRAEAEWAMLDNAFGRVTAEDVLSAVTLPVVRAAGKDGIAVRSAAFAHGLPDASGWVYGQDYVRADTGDDFPDAFDAVVAIESLDVEGELGAGGRFRFREDCPAVAAGSGVRPAGSLVGKGQLAVAAGTRLTPELVAACAVAGHSQVQVVRRPRVGFMATGSELVPWGSVPQRGQNIEANSLMVRGLLEEWGAECMAYPIVLDDRRALECALDGALAACDIVMVNGGSSRGGEDFNSQLIESRAEWFAHGVRAVPGRPIGMALVQGKPVINVPGPVVAALLCMDWLVRGLVGQFLGCPVPARRRVRARLAVDVPKPASFERILFVTLQQSSDGAMCVPLDVAGPVATLAQAHGLLALPIGPELVPAGTEVDVELLG